MNDYDEDVLDHKENIDRTTSGWRLGLVTLDIMTGVGVVVGTVGLLCQILKKLDIY